jgi:hypothetical protein
VPECRARSASTANQLTVVRQRSALLSRMNARFQIGQPVGVACRDGSERNGLIGHSCLLNATLTWPFINMGRSQPRYWRSGDANQSRCGSASLPSSGPAGDENRMNHRCGFLELGRRSVIAVAVILTSSVPARWSVFRRFAVTRGPGSRSENLPIQHKRS